MNRTRIIQAIGGGMLAAALIAGGGVVYANVAAAQDARATRVAAQQHRFDAVNQSTIEDVTLMDAGSRASADYQAAQELAAQKAAAAALAAQQAAEAQAAAEAAAQAQAARQSQSADESGESDAADTNSSGDTPTGPIKCPAGSQANSGDGGNDTSCFPVICFHIVLPDPAHPECVTAFKP